MAVGDLDDHLPLSPSTTAPERYVEPVPHTPLNVDTWISDATIVATNNFEPLAEHLLACATYERLGILPVMEGLLGARPEIDGQVETALSNTRLGYALRNCEIQLVEHADYVDPEDALAQLLDERMAGETGVNLAVVHGVMRDVLVIGVGGGRDHLDEVTPGTTPTLRREAIERWAQRYFPGDDPRIGHDVTMELVEYGYFLHRLFEIRPDGL
jgi:hypothetical protein